MKSSLKMLHCGKGSPMHPVLSDKGVRNYFWDGNCEDIISDWKNYDIVFIRVRDYQKIDKFFEDCRKHLARIPEAKCPEIIAVGDSFTKKEIVNFTLQRVFDYFDLSPTSSIEERFNFLLSRMNRYFNHWKEYQRALQQTNALKTDNKDLRRLTLMDDLTGLHNTRYMKEIFAGLFQLVHRYERPLSVFMLDLDHFKDVNDSNDHLVGSTVLKEIGRVLKDYTRKSDIHIRYGGDEFVVIMPETPVDAAHRVSERVRKTIEEMRITVNPDFVVRITASLGVSCFERNRHTEYWELLREADMAMYSAKKMGRNRVCIYGGEVKGYDTAKSSFGTVLKQIIDMDATKKKGLPPELSHYLNLIKKDEI